MGKGKAKRDKDKYYHLAKEQVRAVYDFRWITSDCVAVCDWRRA